MTGQQYILWKEWFQAFDALRGAFSRQITFWWALTFTIGLTVRQDHLGVTSVVRCLRLQPKCYSSLLRVLGSNAIKLDKLVTLWVSWIKARSQPVRCGKYLVVLADGVKIGKEGKRMPSVKSLHQQSVSNSKSSFIMGHHFEVLSLLVKDGMGRARAIPLVGEIHEGLRLSPRWKKTLTESFVELAGRIQTALGQEVAIVADAFYCCKTVLEGLECNGSQIVSRVKHNVVGYAPITSLPRRGPGRPRKKGDKVKLQDLWEKRTPDFTEWEFGRWFQIILYWPPAKRVVKFVFVEHKTKGRCILMTTHLSLSPETVIKLYQSRWQIEIGFKQAIHTLGVFGYHMWTKSMSKIKRGSGRQFLHRTTTEKREAILTKLRSYHNFVQLGLIAQGLLVHLSCTREKEVWESFQGWVRSMNQGKAPGEFVVQNALRETLWNFLRAKPKAFAFNIFLRSNLRQENQVIEQDVA
jgi:hypothetical protein